MIIYRHDLTNVYVSLGIVKTCRVESNATRIKSVRIKKNRIDNSSVNVSKYVARLLSKSWCYYNYVIIIIITIIIMLFIMCYYN
jgi:hypothetical protein